MKDRSNFSSALILIVIAGSAAACGSSANSRAVTDSASNRQPNAARSMNEPNAKPAEVRTDIENLEKQINLPVRPSEVRWTAETLDNSRGAVPGPTDYRLTALLKFDGKSAAQLAQRAASGAPTDASLGRTDVKSWFSEEVQNAARSIDGKTYVEGAKYPPDAFLRSPYRNGSLVRVGDTDYFVLNLYSF